MGFDTSLLAFGIDNTLSYFGSTFCPHQLSFSLAVCNPALVTNQLEVLRFTPSPFASPLLHYLLFALSRTPPLVVPGSLTADWFRVVSATHPLPGTVSVAILAQDSRRQSCCLSSVPGKGNIEPPYLGTILI